MSSDKQGGAGDGANGSGANEPGAARSAEAETSTVQVASPARAAAPAQSVSLMNMPAIGRDFRIGEYVVEREIGRGAFGTVYAGVQPVIGKRVAIKVLNPAYSVDPSFVLRFVEEARAVNKIGHANIVDIFSFGELDDGRRYFVMERLDGRPLSSLIKEHGRLDLDEALEILAPVARALDAAHAAGIAHRDLKPDNIFLTRGEGGAWRPKLLDFGVAKLLDEAPSANATASGVTVGTPSYMSPEQCVGKGVDHRADIYAFGVLVYRMLTGVLPYDADSASMMMAKHLYEEPRPPLDARPDLPFAVGESILWMLRKDKTERPQTVGDAFEALRYAAHGGAPARVPTDPHLDGPSLAARNAKGAAPAPSRARSVLLVAGLVGVAAASAAVLRFVAQSRAPSTERSATAADTSAPTTTTATAMAPVTVDAPSLAERARATAPEPANVQIELRGIPASTTVRDEHGLLLRTGPGVVALPRSSEPRRLLFESPEHARRVETIVADHDLVLDVDLEPSAKRARHVAAPGHAPSSAGHSPLPNDIEPWR